MRRILHIDMDAFYASVEQRDNPVAARQAGRGRRRSDGPRRRRRGKLRSAHVRRAVGDSDVARGAALSIAGDRASGLPEVPQRVAAGLRDLRRSDAARRSRCRWTRRISTSPRTVSDEPLGVNVARRIKERIKEATSLTAIAGVAPNKFLAKIASGWKKPDGLTVVAPSANREVSARTAGRRAVGRRAGDGGAIARARHREARRRPREKSSRT